MHCYKEIIRTEGPIGLWSAYGFNVVRNSIINAAELASYD
jgi:solute carrier family 25 uncoupling protein 8/9